MGDNGKIRTRELLKLLALGSLVIGSFLAPGIAKAYLLTRQKKKRTLRFDKRYLSIQLKRLKKRNFISIGEDNGETRITITETGNKEIFRYNFEELEVKKPTNWDRKWRMIIFDIPEKNKKAREIFREKLKILGFYRLQDSVFVYPFPCEKETIFIREYLEISQYVLFLTFKEIEGSNLSLQWFNRE